MTRSIDRIREALESQRLTVNRLDDGTAVLLDIEGEKLMTLNATALRLVDWIEQGAESTSVLADKLFAQFEVDAERAAKDADTFVNTLANALE